MSYPRPPFFLAGLTGLFMGVGYLIGGAGGALIALVIAAATNLFAYWNSDRMVLSMHGAEEVDARPRPTSHLVAELARRAGCRCRASSSCMRSSPTRSPPAATRRTRPSPSPLA